MVYMLRGYRFSRFYMKTVNPAISITLLVLGRQASQSTINPQSLHTLK